MWNNKKNEELLSNILIRTVENYRLNIFNKTKFNLYNIIKR